MKNGNDEELKISLDTGLKLMLFPDLGFICREAGSLLHCQSIHSCCSEGNLVTKFYLINFKRFYLLLERGNEGEREGEKHQCVVASHAPPTGDVACNPGMCPDWELNQQSFGSKAQAQSIEPQQPGSPVTFLQPEGLRLYFSTLEPWVV